MSLLLKSNRELEKKFKVVEGERDAHKQEKIKLTTQIQTLKSDNQVLLHDKNALKREVDEMKNEIAFYKAHVSITLHTLYTMSYISCLFKLYCRSELLSMLYCLQFYILLLVSFSLTQLLQRKCVINPLLILAFINSSPDFW